MLGRPLHVLGLRLLCLVTLVVLSFAVGRWLRDPSFGGALLIAIAAAWLAGSSWWLLRPGGLAAVASPPDPTSPPPPASSPRAPDPPRQRPMRAGIDLNTATEAELIELRGIGPVAAARIVADRGANGPFDSLEDLARVAGFGRARIAQLAEQGVQAARDFARL